MDKIFSNQQYQNLNFGEQMQEKGSYENGRFVQCNFNGADISQYVFVDCEFIDCIFLLTSINDTSFRTVQFIDCKITGLHFNTARKMGIDFSFERCMLSNCVFYQLKIKKTVFKACAILECDFTEADLTSASFEASSFAGSIFEYTILEKADFSTANQFVIDPDKNKIKNACFAKDNLAGLLTRYAIKLV
jgi:fluoroquinolone resistance protein